MYAYKVSKSILLDQVLASFTYMCSFFILIISQLKTSDINVNIVIHNLIIYCFNSPPLIFPKIVQNILLLFKEMHHYTTQAI